jgi:hypothetical protein
MWISAPVQVAEGIFPPINPAWGPAGELEMNVLKAICAAATAAIVIAGLSPALAQTRDTRPEPERPRTENNGGGTSDQIGEPFFPGEGVDSDPVGDIGFPGKRAVDLSFVCNVVRPTHNDLAIKLHNDGNVTIPKGTEIVFQLPTGEWWSYIVPEAWEPGTALLIPLQGMSPEFNAHYQGNSPTLDLDCKNETVRLGPKGPKDPEDNGPPKPVGY